MEAMKEKFNNDLKIRAKKYCKTSNLKFEDINGSIFIASVITKRKIGNTKKAIWKTIKNRNFQAFTLLPDGDCIGLKNDIKGDYHHVKASMKLTDKLLKEILT